MSYQPPFATSARSISLVATIAESVGRISARAGGAVRLRRVDRIRTIQGTLAIEGNSLGQEQVTAILEGKRVVADPREILEVKNAAAAYEALNRYDPRKCADLQQAHALMMRGLIDDAGMFRLQAAGVKRGDQVVHIAPPADRVPGLVQDLLDWLARAEDHPLIASSVFHYEFEFIHPFADGNGRMGRLWQSLVLSRWNPVFATFPVENMVYQRQADYYEAINRSNAVGNATPFLEFMLEAIKDTVHAYIKDSEKSSEIGSDKSSEKILELLRADPRMTIAALAQALSLSTRAIEKALRKLREAGRIERIGPAKGGRWAVTGSTDV